MNAKLLPVIIVGVAIGTLIALYIGYSVAKKQIAANSSTASLVSGLAGVL